MPAGPQYPIVSRRPQRTFSEVASDRSVWEFLWNTDWRMGLPSHRTYAASVSPDTTKYPPGSCTFASPAWAQTPPGAYLTLVPLNHPGKGRHCLWTQDLRGKSESGSWGCSFTKTLWDILTSATTIITKSIHLRRRSSVTFYELKVIIGIFMRGSKRFKGPVCPKKKWSRTPSDYSLTWPILWSWITQDHSIWDFG